MNEHTIYYKPCKYMYINKLNNMKNNSLTLISELIKRIVIERKTTKRVWKIIFWRRIVKNEIKTL